jgi:predicted ArsR family transcriptional regulator
MVNVSPVTVRHHLSSLQADGLVEARVERRSVGRPHHVFSLSEAGEELFPKQYVSLTRRLLDQLKQNASPELVSLLFEEIANGIIAEHAEQLEGKSNTERMKALAQILKNEGFLVQWEESDGEYRITEHNCPYRTLGEKHPVICKLDQTLITTVLDSPAEKQSCRLDGDNRCVYVVKTQQSGNNHSTQKAAT